MKKTLLLLPLFFLLISHTSHAASISKESFSTGEEITIYGEGFGEKGLYKYLCFNNDESRINSYHSSIKSWNDSQITFTADYFTNILPSGNLYIYGDKTSSVRYKFLPTIYGVTLEDGTILDSALPGTKVHIKGFYFGTGKFRVSFSGEDASIISWSDTEIVVTVPSPVKNQAIQKNLDVWRDQNTYGTFTFEVKIPQEGSNDTFSGYQSYIELANIDDMWKTGTPTEKITVAVIDDGVYLNHEDLKNKFWTNTKEILGNKIDDDGNGFIDDKYGWNFVENSKNVDVPGSHGTTVAGIIAALRNNNTGISGISDNAYIMPLIACDDTGCSNEDIINAIKYATNNGARVINLSLGAFNMTDFSHDFDTAIRNAYNKGIVIVISAGNGDTTGGQGIDTTSYPISPVCNETKSSMIIGVGASTLDNLYKTQWSNYGDCVDIYALGEGVLSTSSSSDFFYNFKDGTSFSAPIISGIASYILSVYPEMSNDKVYYYLTKNSVNGIVDAKKTIDKIISSYDTTKDTGNKWTESTQVETILPSSTFGDTTQSPYLTAINYLKTNNIISGYPDGSFKPTTQINRAEFTKIIIGAVGIQTGGTNCFKDVKEEWFAEYVCAAKENQILNGYADGTFKPSDNINVAEALKIVLNAFKIWIREAQTNENWYQRFVEYAKNNNLYLSTFTSESQKITREEMAQLVFTLLNK